MTFTPLIPCRFASPGYCHDRYNSNRRWYCRDRHPMPEWSWCCLPSAITLPFHSYERVSQNQRQVAVVHAIVHKDVDHPLQHVHRFRSDANGITDGFYKFRTWTFRQSQPIEETHDQRFQGLSLNANSISYGSRSLKDDRFVCKTCDCVKGQMDQRIGVHSIEYCYNFGE